MRLGLAARVRELHVYGPMVPIGTKKDGWQHRGYGAKLLEAAEVSLRKRATVDWRLPAALELREITGAWVTIYLGIIWQRY